MSSLTAATDLPTDLPTAAPLVASALCLTRRHSLAPITPVRHTRSTILPLRRTSSVDASARTPPLPSPSRSRDSHPDWSRAICRHCREVGHIARVCPSATLVVSSLRKPRSSDAPPLPSPSSFLSATPPPASPPSNPAWRKAICRRCGITGHIARTCPRSSSAPRHPSSATSVLCA
ncbi:uncharacterized protein STEHIDRAFT_125050 [Stereum hirsutum FP-91666 SS1]|uniref:uncharacterized protein n=1 Tax=Stereum hirsutum (strain FP-91666) TaxID=721885 RepID=UPI000444A4F1|nr:uncharacterized protein STEHIDRAFT_125050 [Stereum hirsutum FP-91666 SS1]EIM81472.1 hypothetical protein STEHIDRAFT_125050 [Stereum hirsutum FP-91666 SS1]